MQAFRKYMIKTPTRNLTAVEMKKRRAKQETRDVVKICKIHVKIIKFRKRKKKINL